MNWKASPFWDAVLWKKAVVMEEQSSEVVFPLSHSGVSFRRRKLFPSKHRPINFAQNPPRQSGPPGETYDRGAVAGCKGLPILESRDLAPIRNQRGEGR